MGASTQQAELSTVATAIYIVVIPFLLGLGIVGGAWYWWHSFFDVGGRIGGVVCVVSMGFAAAAPLIGAYSLVDLGLVRFKAEFKIQREKRVAKEDVLRALRQLKWEYLWSLPTFAVFAMCLPDSRIDVSYREPPHMTALYLLIVACLEEICFYTSHRFLHMSFIYKHIHKIHHEYKAPIASVGTYAHPIEHQMSLIPVLVLPYTVGMHLTTSLLWYFIGFFSVVNHHSGYEFPFFPGRLATFHDVHHVQFDKNYGVFGWLDAVFGNCA